MDVHALVGLLMLLAGASAFGAVTFPFDQIPDQTVTQGEAVIVELNVDLAGTFSNPSDVQISVRSSNAGWMSPAQISFSQNAGILNLILRLPDCSPGASTIELIGSDRTTTNRSSFLVSAYALQRPPILVGILNDTTIVEGQALDAFFSIDRLICPLGDLKVTATSSNTQLLPSTNITLDCNGTNWHLRCVTIPGNAGQTIVIVTASAGSAVGNSGFVLTVSRTNLPGDPFLHPIPDWHMPGCTVLEIPLILDNVAIAGVNPNQFLAQASNTNLLPGTGITFLKGATNFSLLIDPAPNQQGVSRVTVGFRAGDKLTETEFLLTVDQGQGFVGINLPNQIEGFEDELILIIPVVNTFASCLTRDIIVTVNALNSTLFPATNITVTGSWTNWTVVLNPAPDASGESIVSFSVTDSSGFRNTKSVQVIVHPVNDPPGISRIADQKIDPGESRGIGFWIHDPDNSPSEIKARAYSSNTNIVADADLQLSNQGTNYVLMLRTQTNRTGIAEITVQAWDPLGAMATMSFFLSAGTNADLSSILNVHIQLDHRIRFEVSGHPGATNVIQASSDLLQWQNGATIQLDSSGKASWTNATSQSHMFFRLQN